MAEIHVLPGIERRDLAGPAEGDAQRILQAAIDAGVEMLPMPEIEQWIGFIEEEAERLAA